MSLRRLYIFMLAAIVSLCSLQAKGEEMTRKERQLIKSGNALYHASDYGAAVNDYRKALEESPNSLEAAYNLALASIRLSEAKEGATEEEKAKLKEDGARLMNMVATAYTKNVQLASLANYNLGNLAFKSEDYRQAISYYEQALRLNPNDNAARHNLRVAQLKQDKNQDDKQDQQDQDQEQQQDQQQDQQQNQQDQQQDQQEQPEDKLNPQATEQILNAMENKENATRQRLQNRKGESRNSSRKNW